MSRRRHHRGIGDLAERPTHVDSVKLCPGTENQCCANRRAAGPAQKGDFKRLCAKNNLVVSIGAKRTPTTSSAPPAQEAATAVGGIHMARRRHHRRHAALAEYGEPMGDVGFIGDLLDKQDLKDYGFIALGGVGSAVATTKIVPLLDKLTFLPAVLRGGVAKGVVSVLGGFAAYKYLGRKVPARYRDAVVAASAVMAGLGASQIAHELFDKSTVGSKVKGLMGLEDIGAFFPATLSDVGPDEMGILAGLQAVEDRALAEGGESFGSVWDGVTEDGNFQGFEADVDPENAEMVAGGEEQGMLGPNFPAPFTLNGLDASVEAEDAWAYEEDLDQMQMVAAQ